MDRDVHEVYAVRYAHHDRKAHDNFIGGDPHDILQPLAYFVWAIVGPHGTFVVDTGFDQAMADKRGRTMVNPIDDGLKAIGIHADTVEDIIVTHLHYDHCGNHDLFPKARYHVQDGEIAYATGRYMRHAHMRIPFEVDDVVAMVRKVFAERVVFHDGDDQIAPGITVHRIGGHSKGLQCVRVKTQRGPRGAGVGLLPPLCAHHRRSRVPDHVQRGRCAGGLPDHQAARGLRGSHRPRPRSAGRRNLSSRGAWA